MLILSTWKMELSKALPLEGPSLGATQPCLRRQGQRSKGRKSNKYQIPYSVLEFQGTPLSLRFETASETY